MKNKYLYAPAVALAAILAYLNALPNKFVYDDLVQVLENPWIRNFRYIPEIFTKGAWGYYNGMKTNYYRPMMHLIYAVDFRLFGLDPFWFHLTNILFHIGVSILVFFLILIIFEEHYPDLEGKGLAAFVGAVVFTVQPIHTEAVAWVGSIPDLSLSFFFLLSLLLYILSIKGSAFRKAPFMLSLISFFVALFCKEPAAMLPFILVAYDYAFRRSGLKENYRRYAPYFLAIAVYLLIRTYALGAFAPNQTHDTLSLFQAVFNVFPLFNEYVLKLLLPFNLNVFHKFTPAVSPADPSIIVSFIFVFLFILACCMAYKRNRAVFFGMLLFALPLLPALYIPALGENAFAERYLYLPSVAFSFLLALIVLKRKNFLPVIAFSLTAVAFLPCTQARCEVWKNDYTLWADSVRKVPEAVSPRLGFGNALLDQGKIGESIEQFRAALKLDPKSSQAYEDLGNLYSRMGRIDEAIGQYSSALKLCPKSASLHSNLGVAYGKKGLYEKAVEEENAAIKLNPRFSSAYFDLGVAYYKMGMKEKSAEAVSTACRMNPAEEKFKVFLKKVSL